MLGQRLFEFERLCPGLVGVHHLGTLLFLVRCVRMKVDKLLFAVVREKKDACVERPDRRLEGALRSAVVGRLAERFPGEKYTVLKSLNQIKSMADDDR